MESPPWADIPLRGPILRTNDAAEYLGLSVPYTYALIQRGDLPRPIKIGARATGIPRDWLDAVIAARAAGGGA
jgi:excisionase family DNA binding protein